MVLQTYQEWSLIKEQEAALNTINHPKTKKEKREKKKIYGWPTGIWKSALHLRMVICIIIRKMQIKTSLHQWDWQISKEQQQPLLCRTMNLYPLLVGMWTGWILLKNSMVTSKKKKTKNWASMWSSNSTSGHLLQGPQNWILQRHKD